MCRDSHDGSSCIDICLIIAKICHIVCRVHIYPYIQSLSKYNVRIIAYSLILSKYILMWCHVGILILMIELINPRLIITHNLQPCFNFRWRIAKIEQLPFLANLHAICRSCGRKYPYYCLQHAITYFYGPCKQEYWTFLHISLTWYAYIFHLTI